MKKFGIILISTEVGGLERRILRLSEHLKNYDKTKDRFVLFLSEPVFRRCKEEHIANLDGIDVTIVPLPSNRLNLRFVFRLIAGVLRKRPALHGIITFESGLKFAWIFRIVGLKLYCFVVNSRPFFRMTKYPLLNSLGIRLSFLASRRVDCLSPEIARYVREHVRLLDPRKISVSPCSFIIHPQEVDSRSKKKIVAWAGAFLPDKQPEVFVKAIQQAQEDLRRRDFQVKIYGRGPLEDTLKRMITSLSLQDIVRIEYRPNVSEAFKEVMVFVTTQTYSNYPSQVLLEAMSNGCAVIATDVGDTRLLVDNENGIVIDHSGGDLHDAIRKMIAKDTDQVMVYGKISRLRALKHNIEEYRAHFLNTIEYC